MNVVKFTVAFRWMDNMLSSWHHCSFTELVSHATVSIAISRVLGRERFKLHLFINLAGVVSVGREVSQASWDCLLEDLVAKEHAGDALALSLVVTHVDDDDEPSSETNFAQWVDPFWGCERTNLPQTQGVASTWYWPKALAGNTHPGATLPNGMVSVIAYSGAYPTGYGVNAPNSRGGPSPLLDGQSGVPGWRPSTQYTCTGFTHMQPSGTGAIGTYYNFLRAAPLRCSAAGFLANVECVGGQAAMESYRCTIAGERAAPGRYSCVLCEPDVHVELTVGVGLAAHKYTFGRGKTSAPPPPPPRALGGNLKGSTTPSPGGKCLVVELSAAGLAPAKLRQRVRGVRARVVDAGRAVEGSVLTPPPVGSEAGEGVELFFHVRAEREGHTSVTPDVKFQFWPAEFAAAAHVHLTALQAVGGAVGVVSVVREECLEVHLRVGLSLRSLEQARANVYADNSSHVQLIQSTSNTPQEPRLSLARASMQPIVAPVFAELAAHAWRVWNDALGRVAVMDDGAAPGATQAKHLFYSNLYHALTKPADFTGQVPHKWTQRIDGGSGRGGYFFDFATMWDQYKCCLPLLLAVYPETGSRMLQGILAVHARFGRFPIGYTMDDDLGRFDGQAAGLAHLTLADGLYRHVGLGRCFSWEEALGCMTRVFDCTEEGRAFARDGRTASSRITHTLDLACAAFATARVAAGVPGQPAALARARMDRLAGNWANALDDATGLCVASGTYYEGTLWNYSFRPLPDMEGRIKRFAGCKQAQAGRPSLACAGSSSGDDSCDDLDKLGANEAAFLQHLDKFFGFSACGRYDARHTAPATQLPVVQYSESGQAEQWVEDVAASGMALHTFEGLCNEPDMETPFSYLYIGRADRLARVLHAIKSYSFAPGRGGVPGNIDSGAEASWYVWASVGLFPASGLPIYYIGVPSFRRVQLRLGSTGSRLCIETSGSGMYVLSGSLNEQPLHGRSWLYVAEAEAGGLLKLKLCTKPGSDWGSIYPPSWPSGGSCWADDVRRYGVD